MKKAGSTPRITEDTSRDPERQSVRASAEEADPSGEESKPKESDCRPDREVRVELQGSELWKRFYEIGTEMIITKAGRYKMWLQRSVANTERACTTANPGLCVPFTDCMDCSCKTLKLLWPTCPVIRGTISTWHLVYS